jgi:acyl-CoA thioesterase-2
MERVVGSAEPESFVAPPARTLPELLTVDRTGDSIYLGRAVIDGDGRLFGGQALAQAIAAVDDTLQPGWTVHSIQSAMVRPGDSAVPLTITVDVVREGREFSARQVQVTQADRVLTTATVLCRAPSAGLRTADRPVREVLPIEARQLPFQARAVILDGLDLRWCTDRREWLTLWFRWTQDRPAVEQWDQIIATYLSDLWFAEPFARRHQTTFGHPESRISTVSHSVWLHGEFDVTRWHALTSWSPVSASNLGLIHAQMTNPDGEVVATVAQEALLRAKGESSRARAAATDAYSSTTEDREGS